MRVGLDPLEADCVVVVVDLVVGMVVYLLRVKEGVDFEMERVVVVEDCE